MTLLAASAYQAAVALEWISMGSEPGDDAVGQGVVTTAAMLALLLAAGYFTMQLLRREAKASSSAPLVPLAAATYVAAHFYSFDSYYLPTLRRFSDAGSVADWWVYVLIAAALAVTALMMASPRVGSLAAALLIIVCAGTVVAEGIGH